MSKVVVVFGLTSGDNGAAVTVSEAPLENNGALLVRREDVIIEVTKEDDVDHYVSKDTVELPEGVEKGDIPTVELKQDGVKSEEDLTAAIDEAKAEFENEA